MNILKLFFALLRDFVPMENQEFSKMQAEGHQWLDAIRTDDDYINDPNTKKTDVLLAKGKRASDMWYMRALFAVLYLWGKRQLTIYTNPTFVVPETED
jgi:hypothetical protein